MEETYSDSQFYVNMLNRCFFVFSEYICASQNKTVYLCKCNCSFDALHSHTLIYIYFCVFFYLHVFFADIDECMSEPCQNGASCVDDINSYNCTCVDGFEGSNCENGKTKEFFLNVSPNSLNSVTKIFLITVKGLKPATSCVRDQDATTAPARHM